MEQEDDATKEVRYPAGGGGPPGDEKPTVRATGAPPEPSALAGKDRTGETLGGRYRLLRRLGSGGMGTVYLAEHIHLSRPTAVKLLHPELCLDPRSEERFRREALLASSINHPTVAQV